jgi:E3 ubiquitin-protein ligase DOA10
MNRNDVVACTVYRPPVKVNEASNVENVNGKRKKSDAKAKISYRDSLDTITKARYVDKLKEIDGKDPYEMEKAECIQ